MIIDDFVPPYKPHDNMLKTAIDERDRLYESISLYKDCGYKNEDLFEKRILVFINRVDEWINNYKNMNKNL